MKSKLGKVIKSMADLSTRMEKTFSTGVVEGFDEKWETQSFLNLLLASTLCLVTLVGHQWKSVIPRLEEELKTMIDTCKKEYDS